MAYLQDCLVSKESLQEFLATRCIHCLEVLQHRTTVTLCPYDITKRELERDTRSECLQKAYQQYYASAGFIAGSNLY